MVNHAWTLLINRDATTHTDGGRAGTVLLGDEVLSPGYRAVSLPSELHAVRRQLFGTQPDRLMLNYRTRQFVALLHATPLVEYVLALDGRITYDLDDDTFLSEAIFRGIFNTPDAARAEDLTLLGAPTAPDAAGQMAWSYAINILNEDTASVTVIRPRSAKTYPLAWDGTSSGPIPLPGSGYSVRTATNDPAASWYVGIVNRPQWDLGQLAANLDRVGEPTLLRLFGVTDEEPYQTCRHLWASHRELPLRLGGLLLALIYRTEEVRRGV